MIVIRGVLELFTRTLYRRGLLVRVGLQLLCLFILCFSMNSYSADLKNNLDKSLSPYLLQHKDNPIWWQEWSNEILDLAKKQNKLLFISVGYSACHWCHEMNRESFSQQDVALIINESYLAIKIDREIRPDLDQQYIFQMTELGLDSGWPLNLWLTPDGHVFFGQSYLDKVQFTSVLKKIAKTWQENPAKILETTKKLKERIEADNKFLSQTKSIPELTKQLQTFFIDTESRIEKHLLFEARFPNPLRLKALQNLTKPSVKLAKYLNKTYQDMATGGIYDAIDGGFFRYTSDPYWLKPHFEKMLYDNAQLAEAFAEVGTQTNNKFYQRISRETVDFIFKYMQDSNGGFYSSLNSESEENGKKGELGEKGSDLKSREGFYYSFNNEDLKVLFKANKFLYNFFQRINQSEEKLSFLRRTARTFDKSYNSVHQSLAGLRMNKKFPDVDKKIITSWNAIMISSLCRLYQLSGNQVYLDQAVLAVKYIQKVHYKGNKLFRYSFDAQPMQSALAEDYVLLIRSLLDLYQSNLEEQYLVWALDLENQLEKNYLVKEACFDFLVLKKISEATSNTTDTTDKDEAKDSYLPSSLVVNYENQLRFYALTADKKFKLLAANLSVRILKTRTNVSNYSTLVNVMNIYSRPAIDIVIIKGDETKSTNSIKKLMNFIYKKENQPSLAIVKNSQSAIANLTIFDGKIKIKNMTTYYLCTQGKCFMPEADVNVILKRISSLRSLK